MLCSNPEPADKASSISACRRVSCAVAWVQEIAAQAPLIRHLRMKQWRQFVLKCHSLKSRMAGGYAGCSARTPMPVWSKADLTRCPISAHRAGIWMGNRGVHPPDLCLRVSGPAAAAYPAGDHLREARLLPASHADGASGRSVSMAGDSDQRISLDAGGEGGRRYHPRPTGSPVVSRCGRPWPCAGPTGTANAPMGNGARIRTRRTADRAPAGPGRWPRWGLAWVHIPWTASCRLAGVSKERVVEQRRRGRSQRGKARRRR